MRLQVRVEGEFEEAVVVRKFRTTTPDGAMEGLLLFLARKGDAVYDLYDIGRDGNTILRLKIDKGL